MLEAIAVRLATAIVTKVATQKLFAALIVYGLRKSCNKWGADYLCMLANEVAIALDRPDLVRPMPTPPPEPETRPEGQPEPAPGPPLEWRPGQGWQVASRAPEKTDTEKPA